MGGKELCKDRFDKALLFLPLSSNNIRWQSLILHSAVHISAHLHIQSMQHQCDQHRLWPEGDVIRYQTSECSTVTVKEMSALFLFCDGPEPVLKIKLCLQILRECLLGVRDAPPCPAPKHPSSTTNLRVLTGTHGFSFRLQLVWLSHVKCLGFWCVGTVR